MKNRTMHLFPRLQTRTNCMLTSPLLPSEDLWRKDHILHATSESRKSTVNPWTELMVETWMYTENWTKLQYITGFVKAFSHLLSICSSKGYLQNFVRTKADSVSRDNTKSHTKAFVRIYTYTVIFTLSSNFSKSGILECQQ